jgi:hypothetical protein
VIERAITVAEPVLAIDGHRIHLVGELLEVFLNARRRNQEMGDPAARAAWGRNTIGGADCQLIVTIEGGAR